MRSHQVHLPPAQCEHLPSAQAATRADKDKRSIPGVDGVSEEIHLGDRQESLLLMLDLRQLDPFGPVGRDESGFHGTLHCLVQDLVLLRHRGWCKLGG